MRIDGVGTAVPEHDADQGEAAGLHAELSALTPSRARVLDALYRRSGVSRRGSVLLERVEGALAARQGFYVPVRHEGDLGPRTAQRMAAYERHAPPLALRAAGAALADADADAASVRRLVTVSCTGFVSPGLDAYLIDRLGLSRDVQRTNVGFMGCHGALNGLQVARASLDGDARDGNADEGAVLVCAVELCSLHYQYGWDPDSMVANALFADGAGALLCRAGTHAAGASDSWPVAATGTLLLEDSADDMTWRIGDHGFRMELSSRVPDLIRARVGPWLRGWLSEHDLRPSDVASWAVHPGGPRILDAVEDALELPPPATGVSRRVLERHGNMSSATVLFVLHRLRTRGARLPCVALGFGPGLVFEAVLFA